MASLNFRQFSQPSLPITMNDAEETLFTVTTPSVELVETLEANKDAIIESISTGNKDSLDEVWNLAAKLISCNRECRHVTADELKGRYGMTYGMLFAFFKVYEEDLLAEIENAKN